MNMKLASLALFAAPFAALAATSEITVDLKLDYDEFVVGESVGAVVNIVNVSADNLSAGYADSEDRFFIELFRSRDMSQLQRISNGPFIAPFLIKPNEGQKLATRIADLYDMRFPGRFLARPVLVHRNIRYEGQLRTFDVVPGMRVANALQMFANHDGLRREFELVSWNRGGTSHLFITTRDSGTVDCGYQTFDLGEMMKVTRPTISIMPTGEIVVLHRIDPDSFVRSEFWSVPDGIEFVRRELVQDPETAGSQRVRELYEESGGIKAKKNPWWKFW